MHTGPFTQTSSATPCCDGRVQVVALTRDADPAAHLELVRCSSCGEGRWRLGGVEVSRAAALAALATTYAGTTPRPPRPVRAHRVPSAPRNAARPASLAAGGAASSAASSSVAGTARSSGELADLLPGWQVLGSR